MNLQQKKGVQCINIDGSCKKNGTENAVAGFGIFWRDNNPNNISEDIPDTDPQTNQTAELTAAVRAVHQVSELGIEQVYIQTDGTYVQKGITCWINNWMANSWKMAQGAEVKHRVLRESQSDKCKKVDVIWKHVKGHAGDPGNEYADTLSKMATDRQREVTSTNVKEKVLARKTSISPHTSDENGCTSWAIKEQIERQQEHTKRKSQDILTEAKLCGVGRKTKLFVCFTLHTNLS